jgi:hypothetical protein
LVTLSRNGLAIRRRLCAAGIYSLAKEQHLIVERTAGAGLRRAASIAAMSICFIVR